jgi:DNA replicative helicase MCM subunit Mcm2 (Cdc46/Mcm family)
LGLEKTRQTRKTINSLYDQNGVITRQQTKILQLSKSYYENLCKSTHPNIEEVKTWIDNTKINKKLRMEESLIWWKIEYRRVQYLKCV